MKLTDVIGNYILSGRLQAIAMTTASAIVSLPLSPLAFIISGSVIGLISLRKGAAIGLQTILFSLLLLGLFSLLLGQSVYFCLAYAILIWLPVWVVASSLRVTQRQEMLVVSAATLAVAMIVMMYATLGDVSAWWQQWFNEMLDKAVTADQAAQYKAVFEPAMKMLNGMLAAGLMLNIVMAVLCARWWQSRLFNPGGFQQEFFALRLPVVVLPISLLLVVLAFVSTGLWQAMFRDILVVMVFMYLIQGIASVHRQVDTFKLSGAWLVAMYCLMVLLPQMMIFIAFLGMIDLYRR